MANLASSKTSIICDDEFLRILALMERNRDISVSFAASRVLKTNPEKLRNFLTKYQGVIEYLNTMQELIDSCSKE